MSQEKAVDSAPNDWELARALVIDDGKNPNFLRQTGTFAMILVSRSMGIEPPDPSLLEYNPDKYLDTEPSQ